MKKKDYTTPATQVIELQQEYQLLAGSPDANGMNKTLLEDEVDEGW